MRVECCEPPPSAVIMSVFYWVVAMMARSMMMVRMLKFNLLLPKQLRALFCTDGRCTTTPTSCALDIQ